MAAEDRLRELVAEHLDLDREPNFDATLPDIGVSSMAAMAFKKVVEEDFGVSVPTECLGSLRKLADYLNSAAK
ncbi:MAG: acyl carrier protein [Gemmatimonadales bacterium]|nr:acyl carrier protein [Gemmatimonadales bacterium]MYG48291.1 acyl carrier protein [Gemmatimonadales bacterium]MYK02574.1 acyl carrier protein [Candidatus Palauibacter ramosifaciens]